MELFLKNTEGKKVGTIEFFKNFEVKNINTGLVHEAVVNYLANQRQGNSSVKTRAEVSGGGKKPWKQKGTGRARAGSNRSPLWRGGGVVFGPNVRDYSSSMPSKKKKKALQNALSLQASNENILVVESFPKINKTKQVVDFLKKLEIQGKALIVLKAQDSDFLRSVRNISQVALTYVDKINTYEVMSFDNLIMDRESVDFLNQKFEEGV